MRAPGFLLTLVLFSSAAIASAAGPPRQALLSMRMSAEDGELRYLTQTLDGGGAEVIAFAINRDDGRTVEIRLRFSYSIPPDTIALDEIIHRITFVTVGEYGSVIGRARLRTGDINLNPNGPSLAYRVTLYRPQSQYRVKMRVFGNYE